LPGRSTTPWSRAGPLLLLLLLFARNAVSVLLLFFLFSVVVAVNVLAAKTRRLDQILAVGVISSSLYRRAWVVRQTHEKMVAVAEQTHLGRAHSSRSEARAAGWELIDLLLGFLLLVPTHS
jgi:hypothetical protein